QAGADPVREEAPAVDGVALVEEKSLAEERRVAVVAWPAARGGLQRRARRQRHVEDRPSRGGHEEVAQLRLDRMTKLLEAEVVEVEDARELRPRAPAHLGELAAAVGVEARQLGRRAEVRADTGGRHDEGDLLGVGQMIRGLAQPAGERPVERAAEVEGQEHLGPEVAAQARIAALALIVDRLSLHAADEQVTEQWHRVFGLEPRQLLEGERLRIDEILVVRVLEPRETVVPGLDDPGAGRREAAAPQLQVPPGRERERVDFLEERIVADGEQAQVELAAAVERLAVLA